MKRKCMAALAAVVLLVLAACGRQDRPDVKDPVGQTDADTYAYWTDDRWVYNGGGGKTRYPLYLSEEIKGPDMDPDGEYGSHSSDYRTLGNVIYGLEGFHRQTQEGWERRYYISRYDGTGGEIRYWPVELPPPEEYGADMFSVAAFDVQSDQELVLFLQGQKEGTFSCYLAQHVTLEGETLSVTDLYPAMQELGVKTVYTFVAAYVDGEGYYYLIPEKAGGGRGDDVNVLDPAGKPVGSMTPPAEGYERASWAMKLPDGSPVFSWSKSENASILMAVYDRERDASRTLFEQNSLMDCRLWTPAQDGYLYYVDFFQGDKLCRCDIRTGSVEDCMHFPQLGLDGVPLAQLIIGESGEPEILGRKGEETIICKLGTEKPETEALRLLSGYGFSNYVESCAVSFSRDHRDCPVQLEYSEGDEEAYWTRAMAELVSGKGADMYYIGLSEMRMLQEKGVLMDLSELISEETLEALWPCVLESGTLDGQLVGIIASPCWVETMIVPDEIWSGDHWTLQEALDVIEAHTQMRYPLITRFQFDSYDILKWLVLNSLAYSPFLDLEKGSCDFDNPLFIRALEVAGACEKPVDDAAAWELYQEKDWVATHFWNMSLNELIIYNEDLGEGYHAVGFPAEGESGMYYKSGGFDGFLVVNRKTEHAEQAAEFLEQLLSYESQYSSWCPVRKDMLQKDRLTRNDYIGETVIDYGNGHMHVIPPGPDGDYDYWLREYREIMESAVGITADTSAIESIIREEAGNYFSGIRDAAATAGIIQNRVQMYLKEQQ